MRSLSVFVQFLEPPSDHYTLCKGRAAQSCRRGVSSHGVVVICDGGVEDCEQLNIRKEMAEGHREFDSPNRVAQ